MIDFHSHLDLYPEALKILPKVVQKNIFTLVVTTSPRAWQATSRVFSGFENIKIALGLHPEIIEQKKAEKELLITLIKDAQFLGEIGLDGSWKLKNSLKLQETLLQDIFEECERQGGRIKSLHSKCATGRVLDIIEKHPSSGINVLHWFSGTLKELDRAIELGCWFSLGPAMLNSKSWEGIAKKIPLSRVLTETDGPFVQYASKTVMPWDVDIVENGLADVWGIKIDKIQKQLRDNLQKLLPKRHFN